MEANNDYGLIYVLTNECMPNLIKIGKTSRHDLKKRMTELYSTGVPAPFECVFAYKVEQERLADVEAGLHSLFDEYRVPSGREFFFVKPNKVEVALRTIGNFQPIDDATQEVQQKIDEVVAADEKRRKNPNMDFFEMGLRVGDTLVFKNDHVVTCSVATNKRVSYNDEEYSLSGLTHQLLGTKYAVQPSPYWLTEDGTLLSTLYIAYTKRLAAAQTATNAAVVSAAASVSADLSQSVNS